MHQLVLLPCSEILAHDMANVPTVDQLLLAERSSRSFQQSMLGTIRTLGRGDCHLAIPLVASATAACDAETVRH